MRATNGLSIRLELRAGISKSRRPVDCEFYVAPPGLSIVFAIPVACATG